MRDDRSPTPDDHEVTRPMAFLSRTKQQIPTVDATAAANRPPGVLLVDVREDSEWNGGHAPGAFHRPLGRLDPTRLPKVDAVYLICRSGNRSARATRALLDAGFDAHNVVGGMTAWTAAGLPVIRE